MEFKEVVSDSPSPLLTKYVMYVKFFSYRYDYVCIRHYIYMVYSMQYSIFPQILFFLFFFYLFYWKSAPLRLASYWFKYFWFLIWRQVKRLQEDVMKENEGILEGGGSHRQRKKRKKAKNFIWSYDVSSNDHHGISTN